MKLDLKKSENEVAKKVIYNLVVSAMMLDEWPTQKGDNKKWRDAFILGLKHTVLSGANLLKDDEFMKEIKYLIQWEKEEEKLFGKARYKKIQEHWKKMEAKKSLKKKTRKTK